MDKIEKEDSIFYNVYGFYFPGSGQNRHIQRGFKFLIGDIFRDFYGPLAQVVEHLTFNQVVWGSNPQWFIELKQEGNRGFEPQFDIPSGSLN